MKPATVQILCGLALAFMTGAVGSHFLSVRQTVALAEQIRVMKEMPATAPAPPAEDPVVRQARQVLAEAKASKRDADSSLAAPHETDAHWDRVVTAIEQLVNQNAELKNQVAETNRDLMSLQFQVDSHSESFRPLKVAEDPEPQPSSGVLPPKDAP